ncbi:hypothetical protein [Alkaliphilus metalliredigens]|uniref:hypothetical protein n=1 Tax=Alkaliphilus metalliredigens TaxID=208226 RepID=UPI0005A1EBBF|nr:hypothetical protein [Alkaliphilus metalliredigens]
MKKHKIIKETKKFFTCFLIYKFIGWIGIAVGIHAFRYRVLRDDFNLQFFLIDTIRFLIAFWIVYSFPGLIKKKKAIEVE